MTQGSSAALLHELIAGRWPGDGMPRLALEQVVVSAVVCHPDERDLVATIVPPSVVSDHDCRAVYEAALRVHPANVNQYGEVVAHLRAGGSRRTEADLMLDGGPVVFLAAGHWRQAVAELARRVEAGRVRAAAVAAVASLDAGGDPGHIAERLARRVVAS